MLFCTNFIQTILNVLFLFKARLFTHRYNSRLVLLFHYEV